jgi:cation diffusion facilitator family transporter
MYRQATRAALLGLGINLSLGAAKLLGGLFGHSFALISDAVNSLGDALTSSVVVAALRLAQKPGDAEHPYGHTRAEAVAASSVALLIIISALYVAWEALTRVNASPRVPAAWTTWIAAANVLIKESLYRYKVRVGRRTGSTAVIANAWDHRADALCALVVLIGLIVVRTAGPEYAWVDKIAAFLVVAAIVWAGLSVYHRSAMELMDLQADDQLVQAIRETAEQVEQVEAVEKLWVRKTGLEYLADIHLEVDARMSVEEGHEVGHRVKDRLLANFAPLRDVLVHLEPHPHEHRGSSG